jgi:hypothetical protein
VYAFYFNSHFCIPFQIINLCTYFYNKLTTLTFFFIYNHIESFHHASYIHYSHIQVSLPNICYRRRFFFKKSLIHRENELPTMPSHLLNLLLDPHFLIVDAESVYMGYVPRTYMFRWWHTYSLILQSFFVPCAGHHLSQLFSLNPSMKNLGW